MHMLHNYQKKNIHILENGNVDGRKRNRRGPGFSVIRNPAYTQTQMCAFQTALAHPTRSWPGFHLSAELPPSTFTSLWTSIQYLYTSLSLTSAWPHRGVIGPTFLAHWTNSELGWAGGEVRDRHWIITSSHSSQRKNDGEKKRQNKNVTRHTEVLTLFPSCPQSQPEPIYTLPLTDCKLGIWVKALNGYSGSCIYLFGTLRELPISLTV